MIPMATPTKKPKTRPPRWLNNLLNAFLVILAAYFAFPQLFGSNDEPSYDMVVVSLCFAVASVAANYGRKSEDRRSKEQELVHAATEFAAGKITLEEYGSQTKKILGDS